MSMRTPKQLGLFSIAPALAGLALMVSPGCAAESSGTSGKQCTPGKQIACACPVSGQGVQVCNADGESLGPCNGCGVGSGGSSGSGGFPSTGGASSGGATTGGSGGATTGGSGGATTGGSGGGGATGPFSFTDSLKDNAPKGNLVGGTLGANGWTVTSKKDRIWYAIPRLVSGSIEFTLAGVTTANLTLSDHEIFAMYDAGHGITEPINYNPEFRDNHYKQLVRIYGALVPERLGEQKFIMLMCPDGAPGYGQCKCPKSFYDGDGWWGGNPTWDGSPSKIKITWGNGKATYSRDGVDVWTNDYAASGLTFGPSEQHFTIGCPRHDAIDDAGMPIGAIVSDVVVQGEQGPIASCPP